MSNNQTLELFEQSVALSLPEDELERLALVAEKRVEAVKTLQRAALKSTNYYDWVDIGGHPYLTATGAEKLASLFGISITDLTVTEYEHEDAKGKWYEFVAKARFTLGSRTIEAIGTASTRSKFFGFAKGELKPVEEVDIPSVRKAAISNCKRNGILTILGLRTVTWEELKAAGVPTEKIAKVQFKTQGR